MTRPIFEAPDRLSNSKNNASDDVEMVRDSVQRFTAEEITPHADLIDRTNSFPLDLWKKLGNLGVLGITVEPEYGGAGMGYLEHVVAMEEISRGSAAIGLSYAAHSNLCVNQIRLNGTRKQKHKYLPDLIAGNTIGALAMSESDAGSDVVSMRLSAERKGDHYILNGHKMWTTNGPDANVLIVYAKTSSSSTTKNITAFIVERDFPGFSTSEKFDNLGMRGSNTAELRFHNCEVPKQNILGKKEDGVRVLMSGLDYERIILCGGPIGIMQACMDIAIPYAHERKQFGQPIGKFQLIQAKLADMYVNLNAARAYTYATASACACGKPSRKDTAGTLLFSSERATSAALDAIQILGGTGYMNEYPTGRLLRDAKLYEIGGGTNEIRRMLIGRKLFEETQ